MDRSKLMKRLLPVVNNPETWDRIEDYLVHERSTLVENILRTTDIRLVNTIQGKVAMIDSLLNLPSDTRKVQNL